MEFNNSAGRLHEFLVKLTKNGRNEISFVEFANEFGFSKSPTSILLAVGELQNEVDELKSDIGDFTGSRTVRESMQKDFNSIKAWFHSFQMNEPLILMS